MASPRFGDQHELSGSVEKHGRVKSKKTHNAKVTAKTTMPPVPPNTPSVVTRLKTREEIHARVKRQYPGWGC